MGPVETRTWALPVEMVSQKSCILQNSYLLPSPTTSKKSNTLMITQTNAVTFYKIRQHNKLLLPSYKNNRHYTYMLVKAKKNTDHPIPSHRFAHTVCLIYTILCLHKLCAWIIGLTLSFFTQ